MLDRIGNGRGPNSPHLSSLNWNRLDFVAICFFLLLALSCSFFWWQGYLPFPFLGGDAALQASYVAASRYPEAFVNDPVLYAARNYSFYRIIHLDLLLFLEPIFGDFGTSYLALLAPGTFIQLFGFYLLGRYLFENKLYAFLLAVVSIGKLDLVIDYWGTYPDFEPRILYQVFLPFVLSAIINFGPKPSAWPWLLAWQGLLVWIHPPSAPPFALATLFGLFCYKPASWSIGRCVVWAIFSGFIFLAVCSPYILSFSDDRPHEKVENYNEIIAIYRSFLGRYYLDVVQHILLFTEGKSFRYFLIPWSILGAVCAYKYAGEHKQRDVNFMIVTLLSLAVIAPGVALADQIYSEMTQNLPLFYDMIRSFRLTVPIMLMLGIWGVGLWMQRHGSSSAIVALSLISFIWLGINRPGSIPFRSSTKCFLQGQILCENSHRQAVFSALEFLRNEVPFGTLILPILNGPNNINFVQAIRYYALKPVVYSYKDGNTILYNNHDMLPNWLERRSAIAKINNGDLDEKNMRSIRRLAQKNGAGIIVMDFKVSDKMSSIIGPKIGKFDTFSIIAVN